MQKLHTAVPPASEGSSPSYPTHPRFGHLSCSLCFIVCGSLCLSQHLVCCPLSLGMLPVPHLHHAGLCFFFFPPARQVEMGTGHKATEQGVYPQPQSLTLQQHITGGSPRMRQAPSCGAVTSRNLLLGPNSLVVGLEGYVK